MYKKDFIESQLSQLADVIAKILNLKKEGNLDEALKLADSTLNSEFGIDEQLLGVASVEQFGEHLKQLNYGADKLNYLSQVLFESAHPFQETPEGILRARKVALTLTLLETEHHQTSLQNLNRREAIDNFLSNRQYE